jgi:ferredoxin
MKVTIDRDECTSCEVCWTECPEVFEENPDDGLSQIVEQYQVDGNPGIGNISDEIDCVQEAADDCPVEIIHVEA